MVKGCDSHGAVMLLRLTCVLSISEELAAVFEVAVAAKATAPERKRHKKDEEVQTALAIQTMADKRRRHRILLTQDRLQHESIQAQGRPDPPGPAPFGARRKSLEVSFMPQPDLKIPRRGSILIPQ